MQDLSAWPLPERAGIAGILTDIDDTLTTEGVPTPDALAALAALKRAGLHVVPITGRSCGWSEPHAATWPVDAIVAENGAVALLPGPGGTVRKIHLQDAATRAHNLARMQQVAAEVQQRVPGARLARDSAGRETDIAIDHAEFERLDARQVEAVVAHLRAAGLRATVSSIHVNGWIGEHDKLAGARWIVRELWGRDIDAELGRWCYVGDSANDERMFAHFPHSIGVANIRLWAGGMAHLPRYVTHGERGAGFAQVAQALLEARG